MLSVNGDVNWFNTINVIKKIGFIFLEISRLVNVRLMLNLAEKSLLAFLRVVQK